MLCLVPRGILFMMSWSRMWKNSLNFIIPEGAADALLGAHGGSVHDVVVQDVDELTELYHT